MEINVEFLASVLGSDVEQITSAVKDGENFLPEAEAQANLKKLVVERVNQERRSAKEEGYGRGKKESLNAKELEIRKNFDLKGATFDDMFKEMSERAKQKPDLKPEDVRNTEIYKLDMSKRDDRIAELAEQSESVVKTFKAKEVQRRVRSRVRDIIRDKGYVGKDGIKEGDFVFDAVVNSLSGKNAVIAISDDDTIVVRDDTGQIKLDDTTVKPVVFDDYVVSKLEQVYIIPESDGRKSPGNKNSPPGAVKGDNPEGFEVPADDEAYMTKLSTLPTDKKSKYIEFRNAQMAE